MTSTSEQPIVLMGASGKVGRLVAAQALRQGHYVRACVHAHTNIEPHPNLRIQKVDIYDDASVASAIEGGAAIISTLGSWGHKPQDVVSTGAKAISQAMAEQGIKRLISLTGAGALYEDDPKLGLLASGNHLLLKIIAPNILHDGEEHLRILHHTALDWTVLRAPVINSSKTVDYKLTTTPPQMWDTIPRAAVAHALVDCLEQNSHIRQAPYVVRG